MQIQYCDTCNLRVDSDDAATVNGRIYCRTCAASQAPSGKSSAGSGSQRASPGGSGIHRSSPGPSGSGVQRAASSGSARVTRNQSRRASPPGGMARAPSGANQIPKTTARAPHMRPGVGAAIASGGRRGIPTEPGSDPLLVWGLAGAGIILAGLGGWLMFRGAAIDSTATNRPPANLPKPPEQNPPVQKPAEPKLPGIKPPPVKSPEVKTDPPAPDERRASTSAFTTPFDARESSAQAELDGIKQYENSPGKNDFDLHRRYEKMACGSLATTNAGKEAAERFKKLAPVAERPADNPTNTSPGLQVTWFEKKESTWGSLKSTPLGTKTIENIDVPNRDRLGHVFSRQDNLVAQFSGYVEVPRDGTFTFFTTSDDGSMLFIGDSLIVNNDGDHGMIEKGDTILLKAGKHLIKVNYYQGGGDGGIFVSWSGPGVNKETIPASAFSH